MFLNPRRTRAGVSVGPMQVVFSRDVHRSVASGSARQSRVWAVMTSQVQRAVTFRLLRDGSRVALNSYRYPQGIAYPTVGAPASFDRWEASVCVARYEP